MTQTKLKITNLFRAVLEDLVSVLKFCTKVTNPRFLVIMEGALKYLKMRDRKLTDFYLGLAIEDHFNPVYNDHFFQVHISQESSRNLMFNIR